MDIKNGTFRTVIVIPELGIVVKLARIRLPTAIRHLRTQYRRGTLLEWIKFEAGESSVEDRLSMRGMLLGGIVANLRERRFCRKTRHPAIQPTHLSLLGFANIQEYGESLPENAELWPLLLDITRGEILADKHHFENSNNFCWHDDWFSFRDYSSPVVQGIIERYGEEICRRLTMFLLPEDEL